MALSLNGKQRRHLRAAMLIAFDRAALDLLFSDEFNVTNLNVLVRQDVTFELQCHDIILWAEKGGCLLELLRAFETRSQNPTLLAAITDVQRAPMSSSPTSNGGGAMFIGTRVFLNRDKLRHKLSEFANGDGLQRVLLVGGEEASGKSYSEYLIGYHANGVRFTAVELPPVEGELEAKHIAGSVTRRLWPDADIDRFDDLAQASRNGKWYGDRLIGRLAGLSNPTWLSIDGFNSVTLGQSAAELLVRLCRAVETGECQSLWLALIGIKPSQLGSKYETEIDPDEACGPSKDDVGAFLRSVGTQRGKVLSEEEIDVHVEELCDALGRKLSHAGWLDFHRLLKAKCRTIVM